MDFVQYIVVFLISLLYVCDLAYTVSSTKPNIVFVLTDDQDVTLGGEIPIVKTRWGVGLAGAYFRNSFTSTPICCPSRASILTGRYIHNNGVFNNSASGLCSGTEWSEGPEKNTLATYLQQSGYTTFLAGKYMNQYGLDERGGSPPSHVPAGWDWWNGLVGNSVYYNYNLSVNGTLEAHGKNPDTDYLTKVIEQRSLEFLDYRPPDKPFFMLLSTPACHSPYTPSDEYKDTFSHISAPRTPSFGVHGADKHWLVRTARDPMTDNAVTVLDNAFRNRWRTLLSVDDLVESVVEKLNEQNLLNNTYVVYASDNGFHMGQFNLPYDKRQLYEFDIRVPFMVRGPGIAAGQVRDEIVLNIDYMPTILDLAGIPIPSDVDGQSIVPLLIPRETNEVSPSIEWRVDFLVDYHGEGSLQRPPNCPDIPGTGVTGCNPNVGCVCQDAYNNTYSCVRTIDIAQDSIYCVFNDSESFVEYYSLTTDTAQLENAASSLTPTDRARLTSRLNQLKECAGESCHH